MLYYISFFGSHTRQLAMAPVALHDICTLAQQSYPCQANWRAAQSLHHSIPNKQTDQDYNCIYLRHRASHEPQLVPIQIPKPLGSLTSILYVGKSCVATLASLRSDRDRGPRNPPSKTLTVVEPPCRNPAPTLVGEKTRHRLPVVA
jgi:hypothetical protein